MDNKKRENEEALNERNHGIDGQPIFLCMLFGAILLMGLLTILITNSCEGRDTRVEAATVVTTESVPETHSTTAPIETTEPTVSIPETEENIPEETVETVPEAPSEPTIEEPLPPVDPEARELLAIVIYRECGADSCCDECRRRVADIVLNRVESPRFANTIRGVLTQENQYWKMWETGVCWPAMAQSPGEKHAVERAYRIAEEVLRGHHSEVYGQGYIWQALFEQGNDGFWCCGTYFGRD